MSPDLRPFVVYGFASVHDALAAEDALKAAGVFVVVIPPPAALPGKCGIAMRVEPGDAKAAEAAMVDAGTPPEATAAIEDL